MTWFVDEIGSAPSWKGCLVQSLLNRYKHSVYMYIIALRRDQMDNQIAQSARAIVTPDSAPANCGRAIPVATWHEYR